MNKNPNHSPAAAPMPVQSPAVRCRNFDEVALGYDERTAMEEARRCLDCPGAPCRSGCPVGVHIPQFIAKAILPPLGRSSRRIIPCPPSAAGSARRKTSVKPSVSGARRAKVSPSAGWNALWPIGTGPSRNRRLHPAPKKRAKRSPWSAPGRPGWPAPGNWPG